MSNVFCGQCGVQAIGGRFCRSCGAPLPSAPEVPGPPVPPAQPPAAQWGVPQSQYPPAPAVPMVNPFAGVPLTDFIRDLGALFLLFGALALRWDLTEDASGRWWVVIATIISAVSVGVPYLVKLNLIAGWGAPQSRLVKHAAAAPYLVSVLAVLINELIHLNDDFEGGIGPAVGVGVAGALLAMQARASDEEPTGAADASWRTGLFAILGGGIAIVTVTLLIEFAMDVSDADPVSGLIGYTLLALTSYAIVFAIPFVSFLNGGREWGRVLATVGFAVIATQFFGGASDEDPLFLAVGERAKSLIGVFLVAAGIALLVSRPIQRRLIAQPPITSWVQTARNASTVLGAALALTAVGRLLVLIGGVETEGTEIVALALLVVAAGAAFLIGALLGGNPDQARKLVVALTGGILLLAIVEIAVARSGEWYYAVFASETVGWFAMPGLILFSLLYPEEIRKTFQPIAGTPQGYQQPPPGYQGPPPGHQPPPQPGDPEQPPQG